MSGTAVPAAEVRRLRVLFSVRPFRGHLHPFIPLARAFWRAGHSVAIATAEDVAPIVASAGLTWLPAGLNPGEVWQSSPDDDPDYGYAAVGAKVADLLDLAIEQFAPDVIIRDPTDLAPAIAAEVLGAVHVIYGLGQFIPPGSWHILEADQAIAALRHDYDLPEDPALDCLYRGLYLSVMPPSFEHSLPVPAVQLLRYAPWDGDSPAVPAAAPAAGPAARPSVLVTLGTVYNTNADLLARFLKALATEPVDVICTLGEDGDVAGSANATANLRFERYLPHSKILPGCQAMLCHAGFNTVMGALCAGVPVVCVPLGSDHEFNAQASQAAGLGLWLRDEEASPEAIRDAVRRVLGEPSFASRARAFRRDMQRRPGFDSAIRRIEALAAARPSS
jgi:UDP:flavonoid glycosyltransferase YjiC (YdhE family)